MSKGGTASLHTIQPVEVITNKNKAVSISTGSVNVRIISDGVEVDVVSWVRFVTKLTQLEGSTGPEWKMLTFDAIYDRDSVSPTQPQTEKILTVDLPTGARPSYKYLDWSLSKQGFTIRKDLPGTDDAKEMNILLEETEKWLAA
jgi:hypothetical protein